MSACTVLRIQSSYSLSVKVFTFIYVYMKNKNEPLVHGNRTTSYAENIEIDRETQLTAFKQRLSLKIQVLRQNQDFFYTAMFA